MIRSVVTFVNLVVCNLHIVYFRHYNEISVWLTTVRQNNVRILYARYQEKIAYGATSISIAVLNWFTVLRILPTLFS